MDLDQQIQTLIKNAPQDGTTPGIVAAIAPALKLLAQQLRHLQYYILQTPDQKWVLTTLSNRAQPTLEKRAIYAFPTVKDAAAGSDAPLGTHVVAVPLPVTHILFQMVAIEILDSIVFFEKPGHFETGTEVSREDVQKLIRVHLQNYQPTSRPQSSNLPPNLA